MLIKVVNHTTPLNELIPLAEQGDAVAQCYLGVLYDNGEGVPKDYKTAVEWFNVLQNLEMLLPKVIWV